jgi:glycerol-3-phosphate O-acyltransferase
MSYALLFSHLADEEVAAAATAHDAVKTLRRREELQRAKANGEALGPTLKPRHELFKGDCYRRSSPSAA